jgi:replicative DNA helicase
VNGRVPPHNLEAEESLLGAMLYQGDAIDAALNAHLTAEHFYKPGHGHIYDASVKLHQRGEAVDPVIVADELRRQGLLDVVGGQGHLLGLLARTPTASSAPKYARIIEDHHLLRRLVRVGTSIADAAYELPTDVDEAVAKASEAVAAIATRPAAAARQRVVDGASFALDRPPEEPAIWGKGDQLLWIEGESCILCGPAGVGKSTIAQQVVKALVGFPGDVLGFPVAPAEGRVLYVAADRPAQIGRSLARMVSEEDRETLRERLVVWRGPLAVDLTADPSALLRLAREHDADTVVLDSLKDVCLDLVKDEVGSRLNRAFQTTLAGGVDLLALHHQRKGQQGGKPRKLDDVYGSVWVTAGAGSVLLLWGEPGDPVVELSHLKQPSDAVGPLTLIHDHDRGTTEVQEGVDLFSVVRTSNGLTAEGAARALFGAEEPKRNEVERARRKLDRLVGDGLAHRDGGERGGPPARYYAVERAES